MRALRLIIAAAALLIGGAGRTLALEMHTIAEEVRLLVEEGDSAAARRDWEAAAHDYGEAAKLTPGDARLRGKLRRALEQRARACEARASAKRPPPMPDSAFHDGPRDNDKASLYRLIRWIAQLKREALEARADAEAARAKPDAAKIARLRQAAAEKRKHEEELTAEIAKQHWETEEERIEKEKEMEKAFEGVGGVGIGGGTPDAKLGTLRDPPR